MMVLHCNNPITKTDKIWGYIISVDLDFVAIFWGRYGSAYRFKINPYDVGEAQLALAGRANKLNEDPPYTVKADVDLNRVIVNIDSPTVLRDVLQRVQLNKNPLLKLAVDEIKSYLVNNQLMAFPITATAADLPAIDWTQIRSEVALNFF